MGSTYKTSIDVPHKKRASTFRACGGNFPGVLKAAPDQYATWAYWHIGKNCGWFATKQPIAEIEAHRQSMQDLIQQGHLLSGNYKTALGVFDECLNTMAYNDN